MSKTITIRTDETLRNALEERAQAKGITLSQLTREILQDALQEKPLGSKTGHLRGRLSLRRKNEETWRKSLRERNWRT